MHIYKNRVAGILAGLLAAAALPGTALAGAATWDTVRDWTIVQETDPNSNAFMRCYMERTTDSGLLRVYYNGADWGLAVPGHAARGKVAGTFAIDGRKRNVVYSVVPGTDRADMTDFDATDLARLQSGGSVKAELGRHNMEWSLTGSSAAIGKVRDCVAAGMRGVRPRPGPVDGVPGDAPRNDPPRNDAGRGCPRPGEYRSVTGLIPARVTFVNRADRAVNVYWLDYNGKQVQYAGLRPGQATTLNGYVSHPWIAKDVDGICHGGVYLPRPGDQTVTIR